MDTPDEKTGKKTGRENLRPPWTPETAPRIPGPGRPKGSGLKTLKEAFTAELAKATKQERQTIAEAIAEKSLRLAMKGDARHLEIAHRITGADRLDLGIDESVLVIRRRVSNEQPEDPTPQPVIDRVNGNGNGRH